VTIARGRVLVTGGSGFIGSHLCERLLNDGFDVLCVDNYYSSTKDNIAHLTDNPRFELLRHDVTFPLYVEVDQIYHLACPASPIHYQRDPVQTTKTAVHGSINMLGLAKRTGARILFTSTSEVYGDPLVHPQSEDYWGNVNPIGPRACYDEGKRAAETLFFDYKRQHDVDIKVVRLFNTYGPRMHPRDGRVVSNFVMSALSGSPLTVYGDGSQTRSFCYVDDLIDGLVSMMNTGQEVSGPINLGNPGEFTSQNSRISCSQQPSRQRVSSIDRCRRTTQSDANRTSRGPGNCWGGVPRFPSRTDFRKRSRISDPWCNSHDPRRRIPGSHLVAGHHRGTDSRGVALR